MLVPKSRWQLVLASAVFSLCLLLYTRPGGHAAPWSRYFEHTQAKQQAPSTDKSELPTTRPQTLTELSSESVESFQADKPALVAAGRAKTNLKWMSKLSKQYELFRYNVDDRNASRELQIPANKGHEAMVYLSFIIDNYDTLPSHTVFVHGHEKSWHQQADLPPLIRGLRKKPLEQAGYISLRCDWYPSCPAEIRPRTHDAVVWGPGVHRKDAEDAIAASWDDMFPGEELPSTISSPCCAQFVATRKAIRKRSKDFYENLRQWLLDTDLIDDISGRVLEKLWAYILTGNAIHCPPPGVCACKYFGQCDKKKWPTPPAAAVKMFKSEQGGASSSSFDPV